MPRLLFAFLLLFLAPIAAADIALAPNEVPIGLAAGEDGTLWFAGYGTGIGRVLPDGRIDRIRLPWPFVVEGYAPIVVLPDGVALFGGLNGVIGMVDPAMKGSLIDLGSTGTHVHDMVYGPDGAVWFIASSYPGPPFLARLNLANAQFQRFILPSVPHRMAVAPDGTFVIASSERVYRATTSGAIEVLVECGYCWGKWVEVGPDGAIWMWAGRIEPGGNELIPHEYRGWDATIGPDGKVWVAAETNAIRALNDDGSFREVPFARPGDVPRAITSWGGALWYGVRGAIRRIEPAADVDLYLRYGDIVTIEQEQNCCFEGTHPVLAFHRRGREPFVRRIEKANGGFFRGDVYAVDPARIVVEESDWGESTDDDPIALVFDGAGAVRATVAGPQDRFGSGIVFDRAGRMHALQTGHGYRLLTIDADGSLSRELVLPVEISQRIEAVDLAADQCTLFYLSSDTSSGHTRPGRIGRIDICTGTALPHFAGDMEDFPRDLRILPDGHLLVALGRRLVRYDSAANVVRQFDMAGEDWFTAVALDRDPRYVWIGTRELRRMNLETGEIVERLPVYGFPAKISVIGEPRAARLPARRRAMR